MSVDCVDVWDYSGIGGDNDVLAIDGEWLWACGGTFRDAYEWIPKSDCLKLRTD
jgi:hypothetical protein